MTKLLVCDGIWVDDFGQFDDDHTKWMWFAAFVKGVIDDLRKTQVGPGFLEAFRVAAPYLDGGPRYGHAAVVVRYPHPEKAKNMQALGETSDLRYSAPRLKSGADDKRSANVTFQNAVGNGVARPAQIWLFAPNSQLPAGLKPSISNIVIESNGRFQQRGKGEEFLQNVLMHEMIHAYHFVIGSMEPEIASIARPECDSDELRAVGLGVFRCYRYSENALRSATGRPLRTNYHGEGTDAFLLQHPAYFRDRRDRSLDPVEVKLLAKEALYQRLVEWNRGAQLPDN